MTTATSDDRREQARRELATTELRGSVATALVTLFLVTAGLVPVIELGRRVLSPSDDGARPPFAELSTALAEAVDVANRAGLVAADRVLLEAIDRTEERLEDESLLRERLLPPIQALLLRSVGLGNEQVYPGRDGWLFFRADVDHLTGPGFLEPDVLLGRARGGDSWERPPQPDPLIALRKLHHDLEARGIALIVMPTPVKPSVVPRSFSTRARDAESGLRNASFDTFVGELDGAGIPVFDPLPLLLTGDDDREPYLRTDTHWTPEAMERVAEALAERLRRDFDLGSGTSDHLERPVVVESRGDLFGMLRLPEGQDLVAPERVTVRAVTDAFGSNWRADRGAEVLLLGDSFTNVFSDAGLGWGAGAGLAERLSFHLRRPVDRIAQNAGGAHASREALAREPDRLAGTRVVVYQFAERELSFGDWRRVELGSEP